MPAGWAVCADDRRRQDSVEVLRGVVDVPTRQRGAGGQIVDQLLSEPSIAGADVSSLLTGRPRSPHGSPGESGRCERAPTDAASSFTRRSARSIAAHGSDPSQW